MDKEKEERLFARLRAYGSVVVALSGGVDSAVLLVAAQRALGARQHVFVAIQAGRMRNAARLSLASR